MMAIPLTALRAVISGVILVSASIAVAATTYTYDDLGRLTSVTYDNGNQIVYSYDAAGNRTARTVGAATANALPTAAADTRTINEGTTSDTFDPRTNDTAPAGQSLTITAVTPGQFGSPTITDSGHSITYTTSVTRNVSDEVVYTIRTDGTPARTATTTITYNFHNPPPSAADDWWGIGLVAATIDPRGNDSDPDNDPLTITQISTPARGTIQSNGTSITYTPTGTAGTDSFTYKVVDADGDLSAAATVHMRVDDHAPTANNLSKAVPMNGSLSFDPRAVPADPDGDTVTVTAVTVPAHGTVTIQGGGTSLNYIPAQSYTGNDSFIFTLSDQYGMTASATASMCVTASNCPPTANPDTVSMSYVGGVPTSKEFDPRSNDTDPEQQALTIASVVVLDPDDGDAYVVGGTKIHFNFYGNDVPVQFLTYTISDGHGGSASGNVTINMNCTSNCHL